MLRSREKFAALERRMRENGGRLDGPPEASERNLVCLHGGIAYIILGGGYVALVDAADYHLVSDSIWTVHHCKGGRLFYAVTANCRVRMHNVIAGSLWFDHKNLNGLDNRRDNLRPCSPAQNTYNRRKPRRADSTSKYKGVSASKDGTRFFARISKERQMHHIGTFSDEDAAARAYDAKARELHGEFARCNFQEDRA